MQRIHNVTQLADLDDDALARCYAYPRHLERPWVRANFVNSIDGAFTVDGVSAGLGTDADHRVFGLLRELAEVIVVGAGTVRAENYGGAHPDPDRRRAHRSASECTKKLASQCLARATFTTGTHPNGTGFVATRSKS